MQDGKKCASGNGKADGRKHASADGGRMQDSIIEKLTSKDDPSACAFTDQIIAESRETDTWYACFDSFVPLLSNPKSLVRNRALSILAALARWDKENRFDAIMPAYLSHITDEKPITARQCVKALRQVGLAKPQYISMILSAMHQADLTKYKDSMQPLIKKDMAETEKALRLSGCEKRETEFTISGKKCYILDHTAGEDEIQSKPCIYWGMDSQGRSETEELYTVLQSMVTDKSYRIVAFETEDWNRDFSPWEAPPVRGTEGFSGGGADTLRWLTEKCLPYVENHFYSDGKPNRYLAGYSLSGLFSLWVFYTSGLFQGAASCSGSLWFPGWLSFAEQAEIPKDSVIYLSLGDREEKTRNPAMAAVGEVTRKMDALLERQKVKAHTLVWNEGGHFKDPIQRTAAGMAWLLRN